MAEASLTLTLIGGPTVLLEIDGFRLLTDPTFDPPGLYQKTPVHFEKLSGPALSVEEIGKLDAVLLSHDQHLDNLDRAGRAMLPTVPVTLTTQAGHARLGGNTVGLLPFQTYTLDLAHRGRLFITAAPARHGPVGIEPISGEVIGFLIGRDEPCDSCYVTGDTVWFEGTAEVARRYAPRVVVPFAGSAEPRGRFHMTMDSNDVLSVAAAFPEAAIAPVHNEGWVHFKENAEDLQRSFAALNVSHRLITLERGRVWHFPLRGSR
jgi:L-ascorbate metabolism protein UlaG (beta-lactamase superfamily)